MCQAVFKIRLNINVGKNDNFIDLMTCGISWSYSLTNCTDNDV